MTAPALPANPHWPAPGTPHPWTTATAAKPRGRSGLSDECWALIEPVFTSWKARHSSVSGRQGTYDEVGLFGQFRW